MNDFVERAQPTAAEARDLARLNAFTELLKCSQTTPIGDALVRAIEIYDAFEVPAFRSLVEGGMRTVRSIASRAQPNDRVFDNPPRAPREFTDDELIQLLQISGAVHELCYCCESIQEVANLTSGSSTPTRFYLNSMYHTVSSLFLVDANNPSHRGLPMGGTVVRALAPMGLAALLEPIRQALDEPFGEATLGRTILRLRNSFLVHGDFSISDRVERLIHQTQARNPVQQARWAELIWKLFHRLVVLDLQLLALIGPREQDIMMHVLERYTQSEAGSAK